jgi:hypothetical protein
MLEHAFHSPEAAAGKDCGFGFWGGACRDGRCNQQQAETCMFHDTYLGVRDRLAQPLDAASVGQ